ncbi:MAG: peroxiredoxin family protein [Myxococcota bacterium]|nr:hypothetical protein [Deltaproteobacteria bacterium]MDQ3339035.1 peroxiredoxin family protein [Myxococcota bacterium]
MGRFLLVAALLFGCSSKSEPAAQQGSGSSYQSSGKKPANARRPTAPPNIEANALAVGAKVPDVELTSSDPAGAKWRLADALTKHARVMLVFYRGDW